MCMQGFRRTKPFVDQSPECSKYRSTKFHGWKSPCLCQQYAGVVIPGRLRQRCTRAVLPVWVGLRWVDLICVRAAESNLIAFLSRVPARSSSSTHVLSLSLEKWGLMARMKPEA